MLHRQSAGTYRQAQRAQQHCELHQQHGACISSINCTCHVWPQHPSLRLLKTLKGPPLRLKIHPELQPATDCSSTLARAHTSAEIGTGWGWVPERARALRIAASPAMFCVPCSCLDVAACASALEEERVEHGAASGSKAWGHTVEIRFADYTINLAAS